MVEISFDDILKNYKKDINLITDEDENDIIQQSNDHLISINNKNFRDL